MNIPFEPVTDMAVYEVVSNEVSSSVEGMLSIMHAHLSEKLNSTDAGPLIQGVVGGLIIWTLGSGHTDVAKFRADLIRIYDCIAPQIAMGLEAEKAGAHAEGNA